MLWPAKCAIARAEQPTSLFRQSHPQFVSHQRPGGLRVVDEARAQQRLHVRAKSRGRKDARPVGQGSPGEELLTPPRPCNAGKRQ